jgi:PEP-CTERM motif
MRLSAKRRVIVLAVLLWLIGAAHPTNAVEIHFQEGGSGPEAESGGFSLSILGITGTPTFISPSPETASISARYDATSPAGIVRGAAYLLEDAASRVISDRVILFVNEFAGASPNAVIEATFISDTAGVTEVLAPGLPALVENGLEQELTAFFVDDNGQPLALPTDVRIFIQSDAPLAATVPEPATLILAGSGFAGFAAMAWRRARAARSGE